MGTGVMGINLWGWGGYGRTSCPRAALYFEQHIIKQGNRQVAKQLWACVKAEIRHYEHLL